MRPECTPPAALMVHHVKDQAHEISQALPQRAKTGMRKGNQAAFPVLAKRHLQAGSISFVCSGSEECTAGEMSRHVPGLAAAAETGWRVGCAEVGSMDHCQERVRALTSYRPALETMPLVSRVRSDNAAPASVR